LGTVETDVDYAVLVSTCSGAWAYQLGDTVRFVDRDPPRLLVTGRTTYTLSMFGEHLIDAEIEDAVSEAANAIGAAVTDYAVAPVMPEPGQTGGQHHYVVECERLPAATTDMADFARVLDRRLAELNDDYRTQRRKDFGLKTPQVQFVAPGSFAGWMKQRQQLGGQHKVPRIINDADLFADLTGFVDQADPQGRR
jgi:hypothetical protein